MRNSHLLKNKQKIIHQSGQVGIIIILIMVVLLTIGLSIATRTATEQKISIEQEEEARVFNDAETAVEQALNEIYEAERGTPLNEETVTINNTQYTISTSDTLNMQIEEQKTIAVPTTGSAGAVTIDWAYEQPTGCEDDTPAILVTVFSDVGGEISARYLAYDPCYSSRNNDFEQPSSGSDGWNYSQDVNLTADDVEIRITPLYGATRLKVNGPNIQTGQYVVESRAQEFESAKAINVSRSIPAAPSYMNYALFSGGEISKN